MRNTPFRVLHFRTYYTSGPARPLFFRLTLRFIYFFFDEKKDNINNNKEQIPITLLYSSSSLSFRRFSGSINKNVRFCFARGEGYDSCGIFAVVSACTFCIVVENDVFFSLPPPFRRAVRFIIIRQTTTTMKVNCVCVCVCMRRGESNIICQAVCVCVFVRMADGGRAIRVGGAEKKQRRSLSKQRARDARTGRDWIPEGRVINPRAKYENPSRQIHHAAASVRDETRRRGRFLLRLSPHRPSPTHTTRKNTHTYTHRIASKQYNI